MMLFKVALMSLFLSQSASAAQWSNEYKALAIAVSECSIAELDRLQSLGRDLELSDDKGYRPLHIAALDKASAPCLAWLINQGADINATTVSGDTPLLVAAQSFNSEAVRLLDEAGADPTVKNHDGDDLFYIALMLTEVEDQPFSAEAYDIINLVREIYKRKRASQQNLVEP